MNTEQFIKELEAAGLDQIRHKLVMGVYSNVNGKLNFAKDWVARKEKTIESNAQRVRDSLQAEQALAASRAVDAATRAADAAERQATTAERATRIAIAALAVAIVAAILSLVAMARGH